MNHSSVFNANSVEVSYEIIRNITTENQKKSNQTILIGIINSDQLINLPDQDNVRRFLGNENKATGAVQQAIERALEERSSEFSMLNGGVTVIAKSVRYKDDSKKLLLIDPSIINGSQSRGVMRVYHNNPDNPPVPVKVEIIITTDEDLIADISIARNFQTKVKNMSIAGRQGAFDSLNKSLENSRKPYRLNTDESQRDGLDPSLAIQILFLLMPKSFWEKYFQKVAYKKSAIYSSTAKWLDLYAEHYKKSIAGDSESIEVIKFFDDLIPDALDFYFSWQKSQEFKGFRIMNGITRDESHNIIKVSNAWVFPIISGYSVFVKRNSNDKWVLNTPSEFDPQKLIEVAKDIYQSKPDVNALGKNPLAYSMIEMMANTST